MTLFVVRVGRHGKREHGALDNNVVTVGWKEFDELSHIKDRKTLEQLYFEKLPSASKMKGANEVGQQLTFLKEIKKGDNFDDGQRSE